MPKITQTHEIDISPERFLNACSPAELFDIDRLIQQPRYQDKISEMLNGALSEHAEVVQPVLSAAGNVCKNCGKPREQDMAVVCEACLLNACFPDDTKSNR